MIKTKIGKIQGTESKYSFNAKVFYKERKMILIAFENSMFPLPPQHPLCIHGCKDDDMDSSEFMPKERKSSIPLSFQHKNIGRNIAEKEKRMNNVLLRDYFKYQSPSYIYESLRKKIEKKKKRKTQKEIKFK